MVEQRRAMILKGEKGGARVFGAKEREGANSFDWRKNGENDYSLK